MHLGRGIDPNFTLIKGLSVLEKYHNDYNALDSRWLSLLSLVLAILIVSTALYEWSQPEIFQHIPSLVLLTLAAGSSLVLLALRSKLQQGYLALGMLINALMFGSEAALNFGTPAYTALVFLPIWGLTITVLTVAQRVLALSVYLAVIFATCLLATEFSLPEVVGHIVIFSSLAIGLGQLVISRTRIDQNHLRELDEANYRLRRIASAGQVGFFEHRFDRDFVYLDDVARGFYNFTATSHPRVSLEHFSEVYSPEVMATLKQEIETLLKNHQERTFSLSYTPVGGSELRLLEVRHSVLLEQGEVVGIAGALLDVTERQQQYKEIENLSLKLENAVDVAKLGLFESVDGQIVECNAAFRELLEFPEALHPAPSRDEFISRLHVDDRPLFKDLVVRVMQSEGNFRFEQELRTLRPTLGPGAILYRAAKRVSPEGGLLVTGAVFDISSIRDAEQQLRGALAKQEQLFAIIGHELRTPAAALKMLLDEQGVAQQEPYGGTIDETMHHLLDVLDDMRIVTNPSLLGDAPEVPGKVPSVITGVLPSLKRLLDEANLEVSVEVSESAKPPCMLREQLLRQISLNLIKNCALHANASTLEISLAAEGQGAERLFEIRFADNGKGIASDLVAELFEPFERGDTQADGTGLGLHVSQTFARELMKGDLRYEDTPGGGATFVLTARFTIANPDLLDLAHVEERDLHPNELRGMRILLAEDSTVLRMTSTKALTKQGAEVVEAIDGLQALNLFKESPPDLVLTDIFMPNMDGYELTQNIRALGYTGPIIGVSAAVVGKETEKLKHCGADLVMAKPINIETLREEVYRLLIGAPSLQ